MARAKQSLPRFVSPSLATLSDKAPDGDNWVHEIKFDGYRIQAQLDRGKVKLFTRKGLDWTEKFPTIAAAISKLRAKSAVFDGELVAEDSNGFRAFLCFSRTSRTVVMIAWSSTCLTCCISTELTSLLYRSRRARRLGQFAQRLPGTGPLRLSEFLTGLGHQPAPTRLQDGS